MRAALLLALLSSGLSHGAGGSAASTAPSYSAASIVNAATNQVGRLAPNTIVSVYGENLSWVTRAIQPEDIQGTSLPTQLPGTGVRVLIGGIPAPVYFVSPHQVNILIPNNLLPGPRRLQLVRDGRAGPQVELELDSTAPALFLVDATTAVATDAAGSVVTRDEPAHAGELIILYATGLGPTDPETPYPKFPTEAAWLRSLPELHVLLNGEAIDPDLVAYAGVAPGFAGLYQLNLWLPADAPPNPEVRLELGHTLSPPGVFLPLD